MDDIVRKALQRKRDLQSELAEIDQFLATYKRLSAADASSPSPVVPPVDENFPGARMVIPGLPPRRLRGAPQNFADYAEKILSEAGRPLTRTRIVEIMEAEGMIIPSSDKARYIGTILWRHRDKFINLPEHGYWLRDRKCGIVRYSPGSANVHEGEGEDEDPGEVVSGF